MEPSEHASRTLASGAAEVAKRVAEEEIITHTVGLAAAMAAAHAFVVWRWWLMHRLRAIPPVMAVVRTIETEHSDEGKENILVYHVTPTTGPDAGRRITGRARVQRIFSPCGVVEGQHIPVHIHPTIPSRHLVPDAGNPWFPGMAMFVFIDLLMLLSLPFTKW